MQELEEESDYDRETDEIFSREPQPQVDQPCLYCGTLVTEERFADTWVWVKSPNGPGYSPFCNSFHHDMFYKIGLWKDNNAGGALSLDEE